MIKKPFDTRHTTHTDITMSIYFVYGCRRHPTILFDNNI